LKLNRHEFLTALTRACSVIDKKIALDIARYVFARETSAGLDIIGTNLRTSVCAPIKVTKPQGFVANAEDLRRYVAELETDEVNVTVDDKRIKISAGSAKCELPTLPGRDFPAVPTFVLDGAVEVDAAEFRRAIAGTVYAAHPEATKPHLHGVLLNCVGTSDVAALDGYRSSIRKCDLPGLTGESLIELGAANAIVKMLDGAEKCRVLIANGSICVGIDGAILSSKTLEAAFPSYRSALTFAEEPCVVSKSELLGAIKRLSMVRSIADGDNLDCDIAISGGSVSMARTNGDTSASEIVKGEGGAPTEACLSLRYLVGAIANIDADSIELRVSEEFRMVIVCDKARKQIAFIAKIGQKKQEEKNAVK
jgi:DNA polymerase-3 subunit beta